MTDISHNYIDLMYFANTSNMIKMHKIKENVISLEERKKYKKNVIKTVNELLEGGQISSEIDALFNQFFVKIKQHYDFIKKRTMVQSQHHLTNEKKMKKEYKKMDIGKLDITIMNKPKPVKDMNYFVKKNKKRKVKKVVMPKKIII
tara:strand:- start:34 stop:471 length:438 start_codon:yes stop_codon:yes gene_type:complete